CPPLSRGDHDGTLPPPATGPLPARQPTLGRGRQPSALTAGARANGLHRSRKGLVGLRGGRSRHSPPAWLISSDDYPPLRRFPGTCYPPTTVIFPPSRSNLAEPLPPAPSPKRRGGAEEGPPPPLRFGEGGRGEGC